MKKSRQKKDFLLEQELLASEEQELDEENVDVPKDEDIEPELHKEYAMALGPTSYEELDALKEAREKAEEVQKEVWSAQDLVYNILYSDKTPDAKSKAIMDVGKGFGARLKAITKDGMKKEFDMELLELRALIGRDSRSASVMEKASDFIIKNFSTPKPNSKLDLRLKIQKTVERLEKDADDEVRSGVPDLLKSAKQIGFGGDSSVLIEKDATGGWRAILFPTNNFKDRDGEIITKAAHEEYVEWVNKNMDCAPVFCTWHIPGTARTYPMDFVGFDNGFMIESCPLTETEAAQLLKMQEKQDIGLSIGGIALQRNGNIITKYRKFEVSDLPLERAANPFTDVELISKEAQMKPEEMKAYLTGMVGEERATAVLNKMALTQEELRKAGVEEKEVKTSEPTPAVPAKEPAAPDLTALVEQLKKEFGMEQLSETIAQLQEAAQKVPVLEALVKEMSESNDDRLAKMIQPKAETSFAWMKARPTESKENVLNKENKEDEKLEKAAPKLGWLSEATGTTPVAITQ